MLTPAPAILLDLDGTLVDSQPGIVSSCRVALSALGHPAPEPSLDLSAMIGPPIEVMRLLLEPYGDDPGAEGVAAYRADYGQRGLFGSLSYPGVAQALSAMQGAGRCSSKTQERTPAMSEAGDGVDAPDGIYVPE